MAVKSLGRFPSQWHGLPKSLGSAANCHGSVSQTCANLIRPVSRRRVGCGAAEATDITSALHVQFPWGGMSGRRHEPVSFRTARFDASSTQFRSCSSSSTSHARRRRVIQPPVANATPIEANEFANLISETISCDGVAQVDGISTALQAWHCARALCVTHTSADFTLCFEQTPAMLDEGNQKAMIRSIRLRARKGVSWEDFKKDVTDAYFVRHDCRVRDLSRDLEAAIFRRTEFSLYCAVESVEAFGCMLRAVADVATKLFRQSLNLKCSVGSIFDDAQDVPWVVLHLRKESLTHRFVAYPPSGHASRSQRNVFFNVVRVQLSEGNSVEMECRGRDASAIALFSVAESWERVSRCLINWVDASSPNSAETGQSGTVRRVLRLHALAGATWEDFNRIGLTWRDCTTIDFTRDSVSKPTWTKELAQAIGSQIAARGCVNVIAQLDDLASIFTLMKGIASVPRVHFIPFYSSRPSLTEGQRDRLIYVHVRSNGTGKSTSEPSNFHADQNSLLSEQDQ